MKSLRVRCIWNLWPCGCYNAGVYFVFMYAKLLCSWNNDLLFVLFGFFLFLLCLHYSSWYQIWNIVIGSRILSNTHPTPHPLKIHPNTLPKLKNKKREKEKGLLIFVPNLTLKFIKGEWLFNNIWQRQRAKVRRESWWKAESWKAKRKADDNRKRESKEEKSLFIIFPHVVSCIFFFFFSFSHNPTPSLFSP